MRRMILYGLVVAVALPAPAARAELAAPLAVSPGGIRTILDVADPCPTFSWGSVTGALSYELVVYRLRAQGADEPILRQTFDGPVASWTPSLGRRLEDGGEYAWSVRAAGVDGAGAWSEPRLFQVRAALGPGELHAALDLLMTYFTADGTAVRGGPMADLRQEPIEANSAAPPPKAIKGPEPARPPAPATNEGPATLSTLFSAGSGTVRLLTQGVAGSSGKQTVTTYEGTLDGSGDLTVSVPGSIYGSWLSDNYIFKVEVFVSIDYSSSFPHAFKGSGYCLALIGKQRGDGLAHVSQKITQSNDATLSFSFAEGTGQSLDISVDTNRPSGIPYRVLVKISS